MTIQKYKDLKIGRLICNLLIRNLLIVIAIYSFLPAFLNAQVDTAWVRRYNGPGNSNDWAYSLAIDGQGNVYVTGGSRGSGTSVDYATIKYNANGDTQWVRRYNGPGNSYDYAYALAVDGQGNVYVTGYSIGSATSRDYATIEYNSAGVEQWVARYNGPGNTDDEAYSLAVDGQGNVYVTGYSTGSGTYYDYGTIKYNSAGVQEWVQRYNGSGNGFDEAYALVVDGQGNVYVTGGSTGSATSFDYATIKYNSQGAEKWVQRYNGPGNYWDEAYALAVDGQDNVYVTGYSVGSGTYEDYATIKYNSEGVEQWVQRYNGPGNSDDYAKAIAVDGQGNVYVTGYSTGSGTYEDYATIKYNSLGQEQWVARYNGPGNDWDEAYSLAVDGQGNVYVTGYRTGSGTYYDYATIKYNSAGVEQWFARYNGSGNYWDEAYSLAVDEQGNVYVTGYSGGLGTGNDYATIKYVQTQGVEEEIASLQLVKTSGVEMYPNPAKSVIGVRCPFFEKTIKIFDVSGKMIKIVDNVTSAQEHKQEIKISLKGINPGIYFLKLGKETKKFIVTK